MGGAAAAAALAAMGLVGCSSNANSSAGASNTAQTWDREADVVICGGGGTGLAAAVEAGRAGVDTLVLEKSDHAGGTTALSGGMIMVPGTKYQEEYKGYTGDTPEKLYEYYIAADEMGAGILDRDLVKDYCDGAQENLAWCEEQGIQYVNCFEVKPVPGVPLELTEPPRIHIPGDGTTGTESSAGTGRVHTEPLLKTATDAGVVFEYKTEVTELITDPEQGVIGVVAKTADGAEQRIKAKRGVVVATGGYEHNEDMARAFSPWQFDSTVTKQSQCFSQPTNTGDGHLMGLAIGAQLTGMGGTMNTPINTSIGRDPSGSVGDAIPGIGVNKYGARFCNEWTTYPYYFYKSYQQDGHTTWMIFDQTVYDMGAVALGVEDGQSLIDAGMLYKGETVAELAEAAGIDPVGLEATLARWNSDMETAEVDTLYGKTKGLSPINTPPYYAAIDASANLGTFGGLKINTDAQVLDWNNEPIPRLFAGGLCSGGWIGSWYPGSGTAVGGTVHWGRKGGMNAAALDPWE